MSSNNLEESNEDYKVAFTLTEYPDKNLINDIFRHPKIYDAERKRIKAKMMIKKV